RHQNPSKKQGLAEATLRRRRASRQCVTTRSVVTRVKGGSLRHGNYDGTIQRRPCSSKNIPNSGTISQARIGSHIARISTMIVSQIRLQPTSVIVPLKVASSV